MGKVSFQITWACDIRCAHCCQAHQGTTVDAIAAERFIGALVKRQLIDSIGFTGGEAFVRYELLKRLMTFAWRNDLASTIVTNARWASTAEIAQRRLSYLASLGLRRIAVSYDSFHAKFVSKVHIENTLAAAFKEGVETAVYATFSSGEFAAETNKIIAEIADKFPNTRIEKRSALAIGHGLDLGNDYEYRHPSELNLRCPNDLLCTVWPDGRVLPCCSAGTHQGLTVGTLADDVDYLLDRLANAPILRTLRYAGVAGLMEALPVDKRQRFQKSLYSSPCQVCFNLLDDEGAALGLQQLKIEKNLAKFIIMRR